MYREKNYNLSEIVEVAELLNKRKNYEPELFDAINKLSSIFVQKVHNKYKNDTGPVNKLRFQIAELLLEKKIISKELVDDRISIIEKESGKRSFQSYSTFSILFPFFDSGIEFNVKESLHSLSDSIVNILDLEGKVKIHSVDFWGSRGFGEDQVWTAIYNATHKTHQTAKQLFLRINGNGIFCGLYDRAKQVFEDEAFFEKINDTIFLDLGNYFERFKEEILNDEYSKASFLSIGVSGAKFYKLSHGTEFFDKDEIQACIDTDIVVVHKDTKPKARTPITQYKNFEDAKAGDFFYSCWGNNQMLLIGQFIDEVVRDYSLDIDPDGWKERSYRIIQEVQVVESYTGIKKWWTPNDPSTFIEVPKSEYEELNKYILRPYFHAELDADKITLLPEEIFGIASQKRIKVLDHQISPKLNIKIVTKEFANIIDNLIDNKGQMLGVFGSWGRGKTYFVEELKKEFIADNERDERIINLTFNAWKYQETEAIWAYLYEVILKAYLSDKMVQGQKNIKRKRIEWQRTFCLNIKRKGIGRLIGISAGFVASLIITYGISSKFKIDIVEWMIGAVGIIGIILGYRIYKYYYQGFKDLVIDYSTRHNYRAVLGLQSEIQEELIILLKHWLKKEDKRRLLLFIDDLDRCNEDKIVHIIDALRVLLDDDYLVSKLIIIVAVDELMLERAINLKYKKFETVEKDIVKEYMDKLFIGGIKFPSLDENEQAVILETYAVDGEILENVIEKEREDSSTAIMEDVVNNFNYPEPDLNISKTKESEFFILRAELEMLQTYSKELGNNITPRSLRIYMYRYLLSKNLASAYMSSSTQYQLDNKLCDFLAKVIALKSNDPKLKIYDVDGYNKIANNKLKDFIPKLVEMVVPY